MSLRGPAFLYAEYGFPALVVLLSDLLIRGIWGKSALDSDLRRVVAVEERSVDLYTGHLSTCYTEANDNPVCRSSVMPASFPTVVPGASMGEDADFADGRGGCEEV